MADDYLGKLNVKYSHRSEDGFKIYELTKPLKSMIDNEVVIVPAGFRTDFATVPYPINKVISRDNKKYVKSAIIHDMLYRTKILSRFEADEMFFKSMCIEGTPLRYSIPFYFAVRLFGWTRWNRT